MEIEHALGTIGCEIRAAAGDSLSHCDPGRISQLVRERGLILFSGFAPAAEEFEAFTSRFGVCAETRPVHYPSGGEALGFHAESGYTPYRPDAIWFWCVSPGSEGMPTGVVDGVQLLAEMSPEWQRFCRENRLRFDRQWSANIWRKGVGNVQRGDLEAVLSSIPNIGYEFLPDESLYLRCEAPMVVITPAGDESFSNTLLQAITEPSYYGMALADGSSIPQVLVSTAHALAVQNEVNVGWNAGDVAVLDNYRLMHRRSGYKGIGRDLRARHGESFFNSVLPNAVSPLAAWTKRLIQGAEGYPDRVGPLHPTDAKSVRPHDRGLAGC